MRREVGELRFGLDASPELGIDLPAARRSRVQVKRPLRRALHSTVRGRLYCQPTWALRFECCSTPTARSLAAHASSSRLAARRRPTFVTSRIVRSVTSSKRSYEC